MPASAAVVAIAPVIKSSFNAPEYDWTTTTLGDPTNDAQGVVHYLATSAKTKLSGYVDAIAVDAQDRVVAVLSAQHFWYPAEFVAQVAEVVATGHGCHADLGIDGTTEQGGGVRITKIVQYSAAAHAGLSRGRRHHQVEGRGAQHVESTGLDAVSDPGLHPRRDHLRQGNDRARRGRDARLSL